MLVGMEILGQKMTVKLFLLCYGIMINSCKFEIIPLQTGGGAVHLPAKHVAVLRPINKWVVSKYSKAHRLVIIKFAFAFESSIAFVMNFVIFYFIIFD